MLAGLDNRPGVYARFKQALRAFSETPVTVPIVAGVLTIDLSAGTIFNVVNNANITSIVFLNRLPGRVHSVQVNFTGNGTPYTQTWSPIIWPGGTAPTLTIAANKRDGMTWQNPAGDNVWLGYLGGQNF